MRGKVVGYNDADRSYYLNVQGEMVTFNYPPAHADMIHLLLGSDLVVSVNPQGRIWHIEIPEAG